MSRNFDVTLAELINLGDITAARFQQLSTWTVCAFFRCNINATHEANVISKWLTSGARQQIRVEVDNGTAPQNFIVRTNNTVSISGNDTIEDFTWYLLMLTNDGTGGAGGLKLYIMDMAGSLVGNYTPFSDQHDGDAGLTANIAIGTRGTGSTDSFDGDIAHVSYFTTEFPSDRVIEYLRFPTRVVAEHRADCVFYLPLGFGSPEPDLSGNQNNGTVTGSPSISPMPPVTMFSRIYPNELTIVAAEGWIPKPNPRNHPSRNLFLRL